MYKWITNLITDISGKTMRDEMLREDAERKEQECLAREAMLARASLIRATTSRPYGHYRSSPVSSTTTATHQPDNTALHLGIMAMAMAEYKTVDTSSNSNYTPDNSCSYESSSGGSSYESSGGCSNFD